MSGALSSISKPKSFAPKSRSSAPMRGYEDLNARTIVSKLQSMSAEQAQAVYDWESSHKKRATVLKAAKQRVAA